MKLAPVTHVRIDWFVVVTALALSVGCGGGGCGGCTTFSPIPGGFDPIKRAPNAVQARVSPTGLTSISNNVASLVDGVAGGMNGVVKFNVPAGCSGSTPICCPGGVPQNPCGPIDIDLSKHAGDTARLVLSPKQNASELDVTARMRIKTENDLPVKVPVVGDCTVGIDTTASGAPDIQVDFPVTFAQDATASTTRIVVGTVNIANLDAGDVSLGGSIACDIASLGLSFFIGILTSQIGSQIQSTIENQTCKKCPSGNVAECGSQFATACTKNQCMEDANNCLQELGIDGRAKSVSLFGSLSPGTGGGIDVYEVAGGYANSDGGGLELGLLGGMEPAGLPRDQCGPPSTEPAKVTIPLSPELQTGAGAPAYDIGIGIHASQLDQFAYAGYDGGLLCLTIGHSFAAQLTTDTIGLLSRSLTHLVTENSPMAVGLRPQSPPTIALGPNTFTTDAMGNSMLDQPLLDIHFKALELDFFAQVDQQWIRVFTLVADVHLPVGLQVTAPGQLTPVIGNPMDAFTNLSVKNSDAVTEPPDQLAQLFPSILGLVLPQLSNGIAPIKLPKLGGLALDVTSVTSIDNNAFLAIFANLGPAMRPLPVHTTAAIQGITERTPGVARDAKRWAASRPPEVTLQLGGDVSDLEWSIQLDGGSWSAWSTNPRPTLSPVTFWLPGMHHAKVRARRIGHPETIDLSPATIEIPIGVTANVGPAAFHGQAGASGCGCDSRGGSGGWLVLLAVGFIVAPLRRLRRRLGNATWLAVLACLPGCDCGSAPCGSAKCMPGEVAHAPGKWTSIASDDQRVMVATYDPQNGDLVVIDATSPSTLKYKAVDGLPEGATPTYDPSTYRGGLTDPGPDVGAWTSIAMYNHGARVAYQDRDAKALKFAYEDGDKKWHTGVVDPGEGEPVGEYANLVIDADNKPVIAYLSIGSDDGMGHRITSLQLARGKSPGPSGPGDWTITTIASAPGTCAGLCNGGDVCAPGTPQTCVTPSSTCSPACGSGDACVNNACIKPIVDPMIDDVPTGTGLWVSLVVMSDGRLAAAYYDQTRRALILSVESSKGSSQFTENILDGNMPDMDRGMWSSAVVASDNTVHVAYQDALGDQLMYTTWNGQPGTPEIVDDGTRPGDRTHPVGGGNAIYLTGGTPAIAYQDGMTADVYVATRGPTMWSSNPLATGPLLDGFSIGATTAHGAGPILAWDARDPQQDPPNLVQVMQP
jgi:hypothetical protein